MNRNDDKTHAPESSIFENQNIAEPPLSAPSDPQRVLATHVAELEEQLATLRNDYLRALADSQNAQARADRRIEQNTKYAVANFVKDLITVADNLGRALQHVPSEARSNDDLLNGLATGVEMTEKALLTLMERHGLHRLDALDQPFDPNLHQAVQEIENRAVPNGTVVQVLQDGYSLYDRLVRPAMVVVSRGGPKRQMAQEQPLAQDSVADQSSTGSHADSNLDSREL
ncbi:Heat shock protein GrpE [invertebrate metagenome]|uniref:Heat shock protein GrpE n=1 Tax=invertebrate metagenome TaxID=1711999 RepID=A0A484H6B5_9ZZZZ